jgi:N-acetylneuraminic acid mutarotase
VPHTATVSAAHWTLPVASGRQAVVQVGKQTVILAGGLVAGDQSTDEVLRLDLAAGRTTRLQSLAVPVHDVAGGLVGGVPAVVGGGNATEQDVVQELSDSAWHVVGHLPTTRSDLSLVQQGSHAFVIGGYDGAGVPTTILSLGADGSTTPAGHLVRGVRYAATARVGHTAYVFGGEVLGTELDGVQAVDLHTGHTRVVARLPVPLGHAMAAAVGSRILLVGGRVTPDQQTAAMWWFDPVTKRFTHAGTLPHPLSDSGVATFGHRIWLLGGEDPAVTDGVLTISVR